MSTVVIRCSSCCTRSLIIRFWCWKRWIPSYCQYSLSFPLVLVSANSAQEFLVFSQFSSFTTSFRLTFPWWGGRGWDLIWWFLSALCCLELSWWKTWANYDRGQRCFLPAAQPFVSVLSTGRWSCSSGFPTTFGPNPGRTFCSVSPPPLLSNGLHRIRRGGKKNHQKPEWTANFPFKNMPTEAAQLSTLIQFFFILRTIELQFSNVSYKSCRYLC